MATINAIGSGIPIEVSLGGTGVVTILDHGLVIGSGTGAVTSLVVGGAGTILTGVAGADPAWTTAAYPATAAVGTILVASAANTITTLAPDTAGYVLTDGGAGVAPSWAASTVGTVTSVTGGTNITASGTAAAPVMDLDAGISGMTSITMADTGSIQTTTTDTDTLLIQGYDVDGTAYVPFVTITNADDPTCDLNTGVTIGTKYIYRADGTDVPVADGGTGASTFTDGGLLVGAGAGAIEALSVGGVGTILTGVAGSNPTWTTATYPATVGIGDILVASAANVIGTVVPTTSGYVLTANGAGAAPTFQAVPGDNLVWTVITDATVNLVINNGYIMNKSTAITATLPSTCAVGQRIAITGIGDGLTIIAQNASQMIHFSSLTSTTGVGGTVTATQKRDSLELICVVEDLEFQVIHSVGNWDIV